MKVAECHLVSISPYSQSRPYEVPKLEKESHSDYEVRTWRERMHSTEDGHVFIPAMAFKNCLSESAKHVQMKLTGTGKLGNYTRYIEAGIMVLDSLVLPDLKDEVPFERLFVPSDGKRGGGKRVWKHFPLIRKWKGVVAFHILDDIITEKVFSYHLEQAGKFIGIGRFRPRQNGLYGRFEVKKIVWTDLA